MHSEMDFQTLKEHASRSSSDIVDDQMLLNMSITDLISELRIATRTKQFDQVEQVLLAREAQLKGEVEKVRENLNCERLNRMKFADELRELQKQCERGKRGEELYEKLLAAVKKNGLEDPSVDELKTKNSELEAQLEKWKKKFLELNERVLRLENNARLLMKGQKNEEDHGRDLGITLKVKEEKETGGINAHGSDSGNNNEDHTVSQRNGDTCVGTGQSLSYPKKDASASGRFGSGTIIRIEDSDDDNNNDKKEKTSQFVTDNAHPSSSVAIPQQENIPAEDVIGMLKRKFGSRDYRLQFQKHQLDKGFDDKVSSSSSSESSDIEGIFKRCRAYTSDKTRKA